MNYFSIFSLQGIRFQLHRRSRANTANEVVSSFSLTMLQHMKNLSTIWNKKQLTSGSAIEISSLEWFILIDVRRCFADWPLQICTFSFYEKYKFGVLELLLNLSFFGLAIKIKERQTKRFDRGINGSQSLQLRFSRKRTNKKKKPL